MTHYYFEGCCYYTPMGSVPFLGPVMFRNIVDISTGKPVANTLNNIQVPETHMDYTTPKNHAVHQIKLPPDFDGAAYLRANPDVAKAKADPARHWLQFGFREGRPLQ